MPAAAAAAWWWCGCGGAPGVEARAARARTNSEMALAPSVYFSKFATKSAVALSRAKFREIYRARSAAIAFDDRLSRAWFSAQKSLARFARQGHATPTANLSQVTNLDYLTLTIPKTRLTSQPTADALQSVHTRAAQGCGWLWGHIAHTKLDLNDHSNDLKVRSGRPPMRTTRRRMVNIPLTPFALLGEAYGYGIARPHAPYGSSTRRLYIPAPPEQADHCHRRHRRRHHRRRPLPTHNHKHGRVHRQSKAQHMSPGYADPFAQHRSAK